jgi:hypothetical protein
LRIRPNGSAGNFATKVEAQAAIPAVPACSGTTAVALNPGMILGVQTHFSQGAGTTQRLDSACAAGLKVILTATPKNPAYDNGAMVYSPQGQAAFGRYLNAVAARWRSCVVAFEIGNEVNTATGLVYPAGYDSAATYVATLRAVHGAVKPGNPGVALLGASTNMIGTGFIERMLAAGMRPYVDGVAVHQYRSHGDSTAWEIRNLRSAMSAAGGELPIWVSEFSHDLADRDEAAQMLKTVTLLSASGVHAASWYALIDQASFPNMGLYASTSLKPTGHAYTLAQSQLLTRGRAVKWIWAAP